MGDNSRIEWTHATWNPVLGCDRVSSGCANCYAVREVHRLASNPTVGATYAGLVERQPNGQLDWTGTIRCLPERLDLPLRWKRPRRIFVNSMSDLFHEQVPFEFILRVFRSMSLAHRHIYQVLTKRPARMLAFFRWWEENQESIWSGEIAERLGFSLPFRFYQKPWPWVWLGVSVENQQAADERIPLLLQTPAAIRFLSCEPLLGPLDLRPYLRNCPSCGYPLADRHADWCAYCETYPEVRGISWVIVGGESAGSPERALVERCMHYCADGPPFNVHDCPFCNGTGWRPHEDALTWVRSLRDQCVEAGVAYFFKQWGGPRSKSAGRLLDGRTWDELPAMEARP